ncbi:MAG: alpha/beta fold hydrolase [Rhodoferax sp.]
MAQAVQRQSPNAQWLCPALPVSPRDAMAGLLRAVARWPHERMAVVGSSLGGFYATYLAERLGCKAVLLNPAIHPARDLAPYVGEHALWHAPSQTITLQPQYLAQMQALACPQITHPQRYMAVIAKGDEVLHWREMVAHYPGATIKLLPQGDHALSDFASHLPEVLAFLGLTD